MSTFLEHEQDDYTRILKELRDEAEVSKECAAWKSTLQAELDRRKKLQQ